MADYLLEMQLLSEIPNVPEIEFLDSFLMEVDYLTEDQGVELVMILEKATKKVGKNVEKIRAKRLAKVKSWYAAAVNKIQEWYRLAVRKLRKAGKWTYEKGVALKDYAVKKYRKVKKLFEKKVAAIQDWYRRTKLTVKRKYRMQKANIGKKVEKAGKYMKKLGKSAMANKGKIAAGLGAAGLAAYGGAHLYKNYLSGAARACAGKTGADKIKCMEKFKREAAEVRANYLKSFLPVCEETGNPQACKKMIKEQLNLSIE